MLWAILGESRTNSRFQRITLHSWTLFAHPPRSCENVPLQLQFKRDSCSPLDLKSPWKFGFPPLSDPYPHWEGRCGRVIHSLLDALWLVPRNENRAKWVRVELQDLRLRIHFERVYFHRERFHKGNQRKKLSVSDFTKRYRDDLFWTKMHIDSNITLPVSSFA